MYIMKDNVVWVGVREYDADDGLQHLTGAAKWERR